jgi:hypothetical protein
MYFLFFFLFTSLATYAAAPSVAKLDVDPNMGTEEVFLTTGVSPSATDGVSPSATDSVVGPGPLNLMDLDIACRKYLMDLGYLLQKKAPNPPKRLQKPKPSDSSLSVPPKPSDLDSDQPPRNSALSGDEALRSLAANQPTASPEPQQQQMPSNRPIDFDKIYELFAYIVQHLDEPVELIELSNSDELTLRNFLNKLGQQGRKRPGEFTDERPQKRQKRDRVGGYWSDNAERTKLSKEKAEKVFRDKRRKKREKLGCCRRGALHN